MKELRFFKKNVYGVEKIYPTIDFSQEFERLTGNKTASQTQLQALKALGFDILINEANFQTVYL